MKPNHGFFHFATLLHFLLAIACSALFAFVPGSTIAEDPLAYRIHWDRRFGGPNTDFLFSAKRTHDNGLILGGFTLSDSGGDKTQSSAGKEDYWVVRTDQSGNKLWDRRFGGSDTDDMYDIVCCSNGGYLLIGWSASGQDGDKSQPSRGDVDYWVVRIDEGGNKLWDRRFGGSSEDCGQTAIELDNGDFLLGGFSRSNISGDKTQNSWNSSRDIWLVRIDANGNKLDDKRFGGADEDRVIKMWQSPSGDIFLAGISASSTGGEKTSPSLGSGYDFWLLKLNSSFSLVWERSYGGAENDYLTSFTPVSSGGFLLCGNSNSGVSGDKSEPVSGPSDIWVLRVSDTGSVLWDRTYGGSDGDSSPCAIEMPHGGFTISAESTSGLSGCKTEPNKGGNDYWVLRADADGNILTQKTLGGAGTDEAAAPSVLLPGGCVLLCGYSYSNASGDVTQTTRGSHDYWIIKVGLGIDADNMITATSGPGGSVVPSGTIPVAYSASTNIVILPEAFYHVADVLIDGVSIGPVNEYSFVNVTSNHSIHAVFTVDEFSVSVVSEHGGASPAALTAGYGSEVSLAITNSPVISGWTQYSCTVATVTANAFVQATPTNVVLTLTNNATLTWHWQTRYFLAANASEGGSVTGVGWYAAGSEVSLTATPDEHYQFAQWSDGVQSATRVVTVPEGGIGFVAQFEPIPRGVFRFQKAVYSVSEYASVAILKVERADGSYGPASVTFTVQDGSATADQDYAATPSTFNWADGQTGAMSIFVEILNDSIIEGNESFTVHLADPSACTLGTPATAIVTIVDDEAALSRIIRLAGNLDFGAVPTNAPATRTLEVWNDGNEALAVTNISVPSAFTVAPQAFDVQAGDMISLSVVFAPTALLAYEGNIVLESDATAGNSTIGVSGTGALPLLPAGIRTISGLTAVIAVDVPPDADLLGVEDELSPGVIPLSISDGGTWDALNRKVKWFFNQAGQVRDRSLQYRVNTVGMVVTGAVNYGTGNLPVTGDTLFASVGDPGLLHPADDNGDWRIVLSEVSASISRWRNGMDDQSTPVVIRGITLYLQGEQYTYDPDIGSVAKRWIPAMPSSSLSAQTLQTLILPLAEPQVGAMRSVSTTNVTISVAPAVGTSAWGLEESIPEGMQVAGIGEEGTWDAIHRKIKWEFRNADARILSYSLSGEPGANVTVTGQVSFDGSEDPISGLAVVAAPLPFLTWAERNGISGTQAEAFCAINASYGQPNGLVYACQSSLAPGDQILSLHFLNGLPMIEIPCQDPSTLPYVELRLEGTGDLTSGNWPLTVTLAPDQSGAPANRQLLVPVAPSSSAFFRLKAAFK